MLALKLHGPIKASLGSLSLASVALCIRPQGFVRKDMGREGESYKPLTWAL